MDLQKKEHTNSFRTFLEELLKYERLPEDVGHCFVSWVRKDKNLKLRAGFCFAKPTSLPHLPHSAHYAVEYSLLEAIGSEVGTSPNCSFD